jgi:hypothetical protein
VALDSNPSLLVEHASAALAVGHAADVVARLEKLDPQGPHHGRFQLLLAEAYVALGRLEEAGAILDSHLVVPDFREGATTFTEVWRAYQAAKGTNEPLPAEYDFSMVPDASPPSPTSALPVPARSREPFGPEATRLRERKARRYAPYQA